MALTASRERPGAGTDSKRAAEVVTVARGPDHLALLHDYRAAHDGVGRPALELPAFVQHATGHLQITMPSNMAQTVSVVGLMVSSLLIPGCASPGDSHQNFKEICRQM
jgi:hypothetical protein